MTDVDLLLAAAVAFMAFVAYEIAALVEPGWHTVSWYAKHQLWVRAGVALGFVVGLIWWFNHTAGPVLK